MEYGRPSLNPLCFSDKIFLLLVLLQIVSLSGTRGKKEIELYTYQYWLLASESTRVESDCGGFTEGSICQASYAQRVQKRNGKMLV